MSSTVQQLIDGQGKLVTIQSGDTVQQALELMTEHEYSQLPVVDEMGRVMGSKEKKAYIITSDSILQALKNFHVQLHTENLLVSDAMIETSTFGMEDDPFDIFKELNDNQALLVEDGEERKVVGIVTSFDATIFFRRRAEDIMLVEEIESTIKDYITFYFKGTIGEAGQAQLYAAIEAIMPSHHKLKQPFRQAVSYYMTGVNGEQQLNEEVAEEAFAKYLYKDKAPSFDDLSLSHYIDLFTNKGRWDSYKNVFNLDRDAIYQLLNDIRKIRNKLMHFRDEIPISDRKKLRFCKEWLERHRGTLEEAFPLSTVEADTQQAISRVEVPLAGSATIVAEFVNQLAFTSIGSIETIPLEIQSQDEVLPTNSSRYAALALHLLNKPVKVEGELLTFEDIEEIIQYKLPASARRARSWWANDSVGHVQSQEWLDVGWRVSSVNMEEETVLFTRIHERADKYKDFFNALYSDLAQVASFSLKPNSSGGRNWLVVAQLVGPTYLDFAFTRRRRFRVELYIDTGDRDQNKYIFDALFHDKHEIAESLGDVGGSIEWERMDDKKASRVAIYHEGSIKDSTEELLDLRAWAVDTMIKFQKVILQYLSEIDGI